MARKYGTKRRSRRTRHRRQHRMRGGAMSLLHPADISGLSQDGAAGYEIGQIGSAGDQMVTDAQLDTVVSKLSGPSYAAIPNVNTGGDSSTGSFAAGPAMKGGRRGRRRGHKSRKGGFMGQVINQAVVPFALLGAQQMYGTRRRRGKKSVRRH